MAGQERGVVVSTVMLLLKHLENSPNGLTVRRAHELMSQTLDITDKTVERYILDLERLGYVEPRDPDYKNSREGWQWKIAKHVKAANNLVLNSRELFSLYIYKGMLKPLEGTPFFMELEQVFKKIETFIGPKALDYLQSLTPDLVFEPGPRWGLGMDPVVIDTIHAGLRKNRVLKIEYDSPDGSGRKWRRIGPHFILFAQGNFYLIAENLDHKGNRTYAIPRITAVEQLSEPYNGDPLSADDFFKHSFGVFYGDEPEEIHLEFHPPIARFVSERRWHESQRIVKREKGVIDMHLQVAVTPDLVQWILGHGPHVRVVSPAVLREQLAKAAKQILDLYRKSEAA